MTASLLNGTDTYKLNVPKNTPAKDFWSVIVYSMKTKGFVEGVERVGLSRQVIDKMKKNDDGSVDVFFAPKAPEGWNRIGFRPAKTSSCCSASTDRTKPLFEKTWTLGDVEKVN